MDEYESLSHCKWECKYHVVFIPKCRRQVLYEQLRQHVGEVFRRLAEQRESVWIRVRVFNLTEPPWYGRVCPVVSEGWRREAPPYPDFSNKPYKPSQGV